MPLNLHFNFLDLLGSAPDGHERQKQVKLENFNGGSGGGGLLLLTPGGTLDAASCGNVRKTCSHLLAKPCALNRRQ